MFIYSALYIYVFYSGHILRRPENITKLEEEEMTLIKEIAKDNKGKQVFVSLLNEFKQNIKCLDRFICEISYSIPNRIILTLLLFI